jgi:hypothetical protein
MPKEIEPKKDQRDGILEKGLRRYLLARSFFFGNFCLLKDTIDLIIKPVVRLKLG